ncbi:MAG: hypothetical protein SVO01_02750 [Thermotogota bacterium]|nr:hypothetical protein [Thermotogota bacterium]
MYISLVLSAAASLRGASRTMELIPSCFDINFTVPTWYTGRLWLLRLGYYKLTREKEIADDWIWIVDHTVQWGKEKCFAILGVRQSDLPRSETILRYEDLEPIALYPVTKSNGNIVYKQLEEATCKTGIPREIISDHGTDVKSGIKRFCENHKETCFIYDITHKVAAMLKKELHQNERWKEFITYAANTRKNLQQTDIACLAPPNQRSKARYMNADKLIKWADKHLLFLDHQSNTPCSGFDEEKLDEKLGWLDDFRNDIAYWYELVQLTKTVENFVKFNGIYENAHRDLIEIISDCDMDDYFRTEKMRQIQNELIGFVEVEAEKALPDERLLGSSEIIESSFGKLKYLERNQSKSGFTVFMLSYAASIAETTQSIVHKAMETVSTKNIFEWFENHVGKSVQSKRMELNSFMSGLEQKRNHMNMAWVG